MEETLKMEQRMEYPTLKLPGVDPVTMSLMSDNDKDLVKPVNL